MASSNSTATKSRSVKKPPTGTVFRQGAWTGAKAKWVKGRTRLDVAVLMTVSPATVDGWARTDGMPGGRDFGGYNLAEVAQWWLEMRLAKEDRQPDGILRDDNIREQIRERRLKNDQKEEGLVDRREVETAHEQLVAMIVARLDEMPEASAACVPEEVAEIVRSVISEQVRLVKVELSAAPTGVES